MKYHLPQAAEKLPLHRAKLDALCRAGIDDRRLAGMAIGGSFATGQADVYSDIDLKFVIPDDAYGSWLEDRAALVDAGGRAVASFSAEHTGLPEMLIVLYDDLIHVDFQPIRESRLAETVEDFPYIILWEREGALSKELPGPPSKKPPADLAWIEARIWTWVWYTQSKILRGELYEALDALQYLRGSVLFPLLAMRKGVRSSGSRRTESLVGNLASSFAITVPPPDRARAMSALQEVVKLYLSLADPLLHEAGLEPAHEARAPVRAALDAGLDWQPPTVS
jgi:hypothetical protein